MPYSCYSYPGDTPRGGNSGAAQPPLPGLRRMPISLCFRYQPEMPRSMPFTCFRYPLAPLGVRQMPTSGTGFSY
jgi:hypothetical protein